MAGGSKCYALLPNGRVGPLGRIRGKELGNIDEI
jgi:hypothetical protein